MDADKDKNVSCFTLDGVVAEMVIEVEDSQKPGYDDFKDLALSPPKNYSPSNKDDDDILENEVTNSEERSIELHSEKREDKENIAETIPETSHNVKEDKHPDKNSNQSLKRRRKSELNLNLDENERVSELPRYPGRKRQANKRYISDDMITPIADKLESVQSKESLKEKSSQNGKMESSVNVTEGTSTKEESSSIKRDEPDGDIQNEYAQIKIDAEEPKAKQKILNNPNKCASGKRPKRRKFYGNHQTKLNASKEFEGKLPFRKNRDAPDVPDLKPKVLWWNGVGEGMGKKLGDLIDVRKRIKGAKSVRALYRVLYFQWPTNGQDLIGQILNFNGFPFDKMSYEFTKRQSLMKIMLDVTISNICDILGVKKGAKPTMINNILNFLLKPHGKIDPAVDLRMQPVVLLERIILDEKFFQASLESVKLKRGTGSTKTRMLAEKDKEKPIEKISITPSRTTRNSLSRMKADEISIIKKTSAKAKDLKISTASSKTKPSASKETDLSVSKFAPKGKTTPAAKDVKSTPKVDKPKVEEKEKLVAGSQRSEDENNGSNKVKKVRKLKKKLKKSKSFNKQKEIEKKSSDYKPKDKTINSDLEMEVDNEPAIEESVSKDGESHELASGKEKEPEKESRKLTQVSTVILSDSSETESAEETKLITASQSVQKAPQKSQRRKGKPLKMFNKISESIKEANFSALQRLHILLFGASDKAENLKGNILAFGGFPFLEGSDEWKQKHFLLSLLAQNNLREYLKLLCIEYSEDDQPTMINKLMRFLAAPSENIDDNKSPEMETEMITNEAEVVSPVVTNKAPTNKSPQALPKRSNMETRKKNVKKKEEKKTNGRQRKVLMSEEEARRLEASFAREQRALARDCRAPPLIAPSIYIHTSVQSQVTLKPIKQPTTDPHQLNALLQTVYKRRALKAAGAVVSTPNKGQKIKLGDIENIKFLIVTSNLTDLEVLHKLIYMLHASKARLRKNILDFDGFGFNEDSEKYKERMDFLNSLGYDVSKRLSFLLGLCPLQTDFPQQDLNELIMYFLMSPCKSKQVVPITQMPVDPTIRLPDENHVILKGPDMDKNSHIQLAYQIVPESTPKSAVMTSLPKETIQTSTPLPSTMRQKAKKSFSSSLKMSPVKKVLLPPATSSGLSRTLNYNPKQPVGSIPKSVSVLNSVQRLPTYSLPQTSIHTTGTGISLLNTPGNVAVLSASKPSNTNNLIKVPVGSGSKLQLMNQASKVALLDAATKIPVSGVPNIGGQIIQNSVIFPSMSGKLAIQPQQNVVPAPLLPGSKMVVRTPSVISPSSPQEFLVQQQTPDGQQKTFKLIRLPPNHPLASAVVKPPAQQTVSTPQIQQPVIIANAPLRGNALPPGFVVMKNSSNLQVPGQNVQSMLQAAPVKVNMPANKTSNSVLSTTLPNAEEFVLPDQGLSASTSENDPDIEILNPLEDNPPTDDELYSSIQEIILSSNFEDITLRNVIEKVSAQFPHHDLTHRHNYMKDCVKRIIIGT